MSCLSFDTANVSFFSSCTGRTSVNTPELVSSPLKVRKFVV